MSHGGGGDGQHESGQKIFFALMFFGGMAFLGYLIWTRHGGALTIHYLNWQGWKAWVLLRGHELLGLTGLSTYDTLETVKDASWGLYFYEVTVEKVAYIVNTVNQYFAYPVAALMLVAVYPVLKMRPDEQHRNVYGLSDFSRCQAKVWQSIKPALQAWPLDAYPTERGIEDPWADALKPIEWLRVQGIEPKQYRKKSYGAKALRRDIQARFRKQLGDVWRGADRLRPHQKALFAIFALHHARDTGGANDLKNQAADTWAALNDRTAAAGKMDRALKRRKDLMKRIDGVIASEAGQTAERICDRHGYVVTALLELLYEGRQRTGVLASAEVLWVKPVDRGLWYPLNNLGRRAFHVEGSAAIAHWRFERMHQAPSTKKHVKEAVDAVWTELRENQLVPEGT